MPGLRPEHAAELRSSGLTDETIARSGIYSVTREEAAAFLGFDPGSGGWAIPYQGADSNGATVFRRFKPDRPFPSGSGKPAKYLSPRKEKNPTGNRLYIPPNLDPEVLRDATRPLVVTEGEKKALAATQEGFPTAALPGVACWVSRIGDRSEPIADLDAIAWYGRPTTIAFDSDAATKAEVKNEERKLAAELTRRGALVRVARLPQPRAAEDLEFALRGKFGADDFLRVRGRSAFQQILDKAKVAKPDSEVEQESAADLADRFLVERGLRGKLRWWHGDFHVWNGVHYVRLERREMEGMVISWQQVAEGTRHLAGTYITPQIVANLMASTALPSGLAPPAWVDARSERVHGLVVLQNGVISVPDLTSARFQGLREHTPDLFTLGSIPHALKPDADCPLWLDFLEQALPDPAARGLIQEFFGYCLIHDTTQEKFLLMEGPGADGKTVVCTVLRELLGDASVSAVGLEAFDPARTFPLAAMEGKLANIVEEMGEIERSAEGILKQVVTGSPITVERKHRDPFDMRPTARLVFATNVLPRFADRSDGLWRRMLYVPFRQNLLDESQHNKRLVSADFWRESGELAGVLQWSVGGLATLLSRGHFEEPESCRAAKARFRQATNPAATFLEDTCEARPGAELSCPELYRLYRAWIEANGYRPLGHQHFAEEVRRAFRGVEASKNPKTLNGERVRVWQGLALR